MHPQTPDLLPDEIRRERLAAEQRLAVAHREVIVPLSEMRARNHISDDIGRLISRRVRREAEQLTQLEVLRQWADIAAPVAFWVCAVWPAVTATFWPWWQHEWGWNMVIKTELIAVALLSSILKIEFGITSGYVLLWTTVAAVTAIPVVVAWRTWIIWRGQHEGALRDRNDPAHGRRQPPQ